MSRLQDLPIRIKLRLAILVTCTAVLMSACAALAAFEVYDFRRAIVRETTVLADILGRNTRAALAFQDDTTAKEMLNALQSEPHIVAATLLTREDARFASYTRPGVAVVYQSAPAADGHVFTEDHLLVSRPVELNGKRIGTIWLRSDLEGIHARLRLFALIAFGILIGSLLFAFFLSGWIQHPISGPILELAATAQSIAERKDYSLRALRQGKNEVGALTDAFNSMVGGIQERERALHAEIAERKLAEDRVQAQLSRLAQLHQITRATGGRQDIESIFQVVVRSLEEHLPVDFSCICLYDNAARTLTLTSVGARSEALALDLALTEKSPIPIEQNGLARCLRGELVHEPDITRSDYPFPRRLARGGLASLVLAPLLVESKVFGVLVAARRGPHSFSSGECEFLKQLGEHVALAAHQARLHGDLRQAYDDLRQSQQTAMQQERLRALGQMAGGIAHDINNALSPVTLYTEFLLEAEPGHSPRVREYLTTVQRALGDVAQTVSRMREFSRPRQPQRSLLPVDLNRLVPRVVGLTRVRWGAMFLKSGAVIDVRTELADNLPAVPGLENEIREALTNLVLNAVDAMPAGGVLTLRTRLGQNETPPDSAAPAPRRAIIEVIDTGLGMTEDARRRCLEPFFTTKGERGTGLAMV